MIVNRFRPLARVAVVAVCALTSAAPPCDAQDSKALGYGNWFTFAANFPGAGYRKTQFFDPHYNTGVVEWDSRAELWLPPSRAGFSWGPYVRLAGIAGSKSDVFQNGWTSVPGAGFQVYPFSSRHFKGDKSKTGKILGPLRLFAEYNRMHYWGQENSWRPKEQVRAGAEYWKAIHVNDPSHRFWLENWNGAYWQSANEFTDRYKTLVLATSWRSGVRLTKRRGLALITPYGAFQTAHNKYDFPGTQATCFLGAGKCNFYWDNRLLVGGGVRFAPPISEKQRWLNRFVVYGEYLSTAHYWGPPAPSSVPRYDLLIGISASIGQWFR